ncbi:odorant receptor 13a-like [Pseudomyrmex gracilis]|uniref:odorant receptor 13a-like n=1 Tax=Pseudomyrmex gracilis TaxID=219809 RepID=UPI000994E121|nr:odorant receptor 13a-like [Pseudomyrmex gracilis]
MDDVDRFFQKSHYNIIRILLSISGLWPCHNARKRRAIYLGFLFVFGSGLTFEILGIIEVWPDSFEVVDCLPLLTLGLVSITKLICAVHTLPEIKILLAKMREYQYSPKSDEETKILHSYSLYGRNLGYVYTGILLSHTVVFILLTLLIKLLYVEPTEDNPSNNLRGAQAGLPYRANYMIDLETYYIPIFLHTAICVTSYSVLMLTFDVLYLTLVQHCCGLFAALRYCLENILKFETCDDNFMPTAMKSKLHSDIVYSIRRHKEAIRFVAVMEAIHKIPLFVHVGGNISLLSIVGFQVITHTEDINRILRNASYLSALLFNTFFENWQGQKVIDSSEKIYESAYNAEWYNMPMAQKKLLMMIMMRSKIPLRITAGNIIVLSHVNFKAVLHASSSYFMLLRSMQ